MDKGILDAVSTLLRDYETCLSRIRVCRVPVKSKGRKNDVERISFPAGRRTIGTRMNCTPNWASCRRSGGVEILEVLRRDGDSPAFAAMMEAYQKKAVSQSYRNAVSEKCRELLDMIVKPVIAVRYVVALGKRGLLWELLPDAVLPNVLEVRYTE